MIKAILTITTITLVAIQFAPSSQEVQEKVLGNENAPTMNLGSANSANDWVKGLK